MKRKKAPTTTKEWLATIKGPSVALLAMGSSLHQHFVLTEHAGYRRYTDKIWALNSAGAWVHDVDVIYTTDDLKRDKENDPGYVERILARGKPVITTSNSINHPLVTEYPIAKIQRDIPVLSRRPWHVFDNTANYMLADAIHQKMKTIFLFGYEFRAPISEAALANVRKLFKPNQPDWMAYYRRECLTAPSEPGEVMTAYLCGVARERGIDIIIPSGCSLFDFDRPMFHYGFGLGKQPETDDEGFVIQINEGKNGRSVEKKRRQRKRAVRVADRKR